MKQIGVIGFGRFGKLVVKVLQPYFDITVHDPYIDIRDIPNTSSLQELVKDKEYIIFAIPVSKIEGVAK